VQRILTVMFVNCVTNLVFVFDLVINTLINYLIKHNHVDLVY